MGRLYVSDPGPGDVFIVDPDTGAKTLWFDSSAQGTEVPGQVHFRTPTDPWLTSDSWRYVYDVDADGNLLATYDYGSDWVNLGMGSWHNDLLYLPDQSSLNNGGVVVFDPSDGSFSTLVGNIFDTGTRSMGHRLFIGSDDRIYVADTGYDQLWSCDLTGGDPQIHATGIDFPTGMMEHDGWLYVCNSDSGGPSIYRFAMPGATDPEVFYTFPTAASVYGSGTGFITPWGIATDGVSIFLGTTAPSDNRNLLKLDSLESPTTLTMHAEFVRETNVIYMEDEPAHGGPWVGLIAFGTGLP